MGKVPDDLPDEDGWKLNRVHYYQDGWLATGNARSIVGVTFTSCHNRKIGDLPLRSNYNLRGHRAEVIVIIILYYLNFLYFSLCNNLYFY